MKHVCILMGGCIGDSHAIGAFSSLKNANEAREWIIQNDAYYKKNPKELYVDVLELDCKGFMTKFEPVECHIDYVTEEDDKY